MLHLPFNFYISDIIVVCSLYSFNLRLVLPCSSVASLVPGRLMLRNLVWLVSVTSPSRTAGSSFLWCHQDHLRDVTGINQENNDRAWLDCETDKLSDGLFFQCELKADLNGFIRLDKQIHMEKSSLYL